MDSYKQFDWTNAIEELEYIFEGATIPFILLGETARRMKAGEDLTGIKELEIGVTKRSMSDYAERTLKDRFGEWKNKSVTVTLTYSGQKIPVNIKFIERNYGFFKILDQVSYFGGVQKIANPFDKYWKVRGVIK